MTVECRFVLARRCFFQIPGCKVGMNAQLTLIERSPTLIMRSLYVT